MIYQPLINDGMADSPDTALATQRGTIAEKLKTGAHAYRLEEAMEVARQISTQRGCSAFKSGNVLC
jgi:hypothetical protein